MMGIQRFVREDQRMCRSVTITLLCVAFAFVAGGCGRLVQPDVKAEAAALRAGDYTLDPQHAVLLWKVNHLGFSKYVGRFNGIDASLTYDPENPSTAQVAVIVKTASIDVNFPKFEEDLRGASWFDSERFPEAVFESTSVALDEDGSGTVTGDFTMLGVTKPVTFDVIFNGGARNLLTQKYTVGFEVNGVIKRSDFGMDTLLPAVGDQVELEMHAEFLRN